MISLYLELVYIDNQKIAPVIIFDRMPYSAHIVFLRWRRRFTKRLLRRHERLQKGLQTIIGGNYEECVNQTQAVP